MSDRFRRSSTALTFAAWCALATLAVAAETKPRATSSESDAGDLEREVRRLQAVESRLGRERTSVLGALNRLDLSIVRSDREIELASVRLELGRAESLRLEMERQTLKEEQSAARAALIVSMRAAYDRRMPGWMATLLASDEPSQVRRDLNALGRLSQAQNDALIEYQNRERALVAAATALDASNAEVARQGDVLASKRNEKRSAREGRRGALRSLDLRKEETVAELRNAAAKLSTLVDDFSISRSLPPATGFAQRRGRLPWPVNAPIRKSFGTILHPRFRTQLAHDGLELAAPAGTTVRAVHPGEVAYADWFKGYGYLVVLDHGSGYYTLYAHLDKCLITKGATVPVGGTVGISGETGALDGPGLYFEVRRGSTALDPARWLRRR